MDSDSRHWHPEKTFYEDGPLKLNNAQEATEDLMRKGILTTDKETNKSTTATTPPG